MGLISNGPIIDGQSHENQIGIRDIKTFMKYDN